MWGIVELGLRSNRGRLQRGPAGPELGGLHLHLRIFRQAGSPSRQFLMTMLAPLLLSF